MMRKLLYFMLLFAPFNLVQGQTHYARYVTGLPTGMKGEEVLRHAEQHLSVLISSDSSVQNTESILVKRSLKNDEQRIINERKTKKTSKHLKENFEKVAKKLIKP